MKKSFLLTEIRLPHGKHAFIWAGATSHMSNSSAYLGMCASFSLCSAASCALFTAAASIFSARPFEPFLLLLLLLLGVQTLLYGNECRRLGASERSCPFNCMMTATAVGDNKKYKSGRSECHLEKGNSISDQEAAERARRRARLEQKGGHSSCGWFLCMRATLFNLTWQIAGFVIALRPRYDTFFCQR
jgi:hypothetical protein